jgi:hypothetical protein
MGTDQLESIKEIFRKWYGSLSIEEIISNKKLISLIETIEAELVTLTTREESYVS